MPPAPPRGRGPEGAYQVDVEQAIAYTKLHRYEDGATIEVWVDPADPSYVIVGDPVDDEAARNKLELSGHLDE